MNSNIALLNLIVETMLVITPLALAALFFSARVASSALPVLDPQLSAEFPRTQPLLSHSEHDTAMGRTLFRTDSDPGASRSARVRTYETTARGHLARGHQAVRQWYREVCHRLVNGNRFVDSNWWGQGMPRTRTQCVIKEAAQRGVDEKTIAAHAQIRPRIARALTSAQLDMQGLRRLAAERETPGTARAAEIALGGVQAGFRGLERELESIDGNMRRVRERTRRGTYVPSKDGMAISRRSSIQSRSSDQA